MTIDVERLEVADGKTIELDKVLLLSAGETVTVGKPTVEGAKVVATAQGEFKDKKILVANSRTRRTPRCTGRDTASSTPDSSSIR
jgi:large subunit ribosomal protein L21